MQNDAEIVYFVGSSLQVHFASRDYPPDKSKKFNQNEPPLVPNVNNSIPNRSAFLKVNKFNENSFQICE